MTREALYFVFWTSVFLILYTYVGYPIIIFLLARLRPCPVQKQAIQPKVSMIIAACNEEKIIRSKLENSLKLSYPRELLEVIVVADGSTDRTAEIVSAFRDRGVQLLYQPRREGKTAALNRAFPASSGEILFFSDANTHYQADAIERLVRNFYDPSVGGVSGRKILLADSARKATEGETAYWSYEASLKRWESLLGSIVTADGEVFAMRRSLFEPIPAKIVHDDMYLTLRIIEKGYRVVYEDEATSAEHASNSLRDEFHLKVRYVSGGYQILSVFRYLWLPPKKWFALEFLSHKVLRWMMPFFLLGALLSSAVIRAPFYQGLFYLQALFYLAAVIGWVLHKRVHSSLLYFPLYFSMANGAALYGFVRYFAVGQSTLWRKAER